MEKQKTDLRVKRTKKAIKKAFCDMIMEMEYPEITVKELTARAMINRNTFYLHYDSIDSLLEELQNEIIEEFVKNQASYSKLSDIKGMIRMFFEYAAKQSALNERLLCNGSYQFVYEGINKQIMDYKRAAHSGAFGLDEASESIVFAYFGSITPILYRQWEKDGRKLPLEDMIELATKLICNGMSSVVKN